jgi:hypothetical protein
MFIIPASIELSNRDAITMTKSISKSGGVYLLVAG